MNTQTKRHRERCRADDVDPDIFHSNNQGDQATAKQLCAQCPQQRRCLSYALEQLEPHGIWGGKTAAQRRRILKQQGIELPHTRTDHQQRRTAIIEAAVAARLTSTQLAETLGCSVDAAKHALTRHQRDHGPGAAA